MIVLRARTTSFSVFSLKSRGLHTADGISSHGFHFFIGYVIFVLHTKESAEAFHFHCLYPSFSVCCYGPRISPRHLKLRMASSFLSSVVISVLMPFVLFVISWVFSALICMPYAV